MHRLQQNEFNPISQRWIRPMTEQRAEGGALEVVDSRCPNVRGVQARRQKPGRGGEIDGKSTAARSRLTRFGFIFRGSIQCPRCFRRTQFAHFRSSQGRCFRRELANYRFYRRLNAFARARVFQICARLPCELLLAAESIHSRTLTPNAAACSSSSLWRTSPAGTAGSIRA